MKVKVAADAKEGSPGFWVKFVGDYEEVEAIDENGFNIIEFDASALSEADKVQVGDHTLLYRDSVGNSFQSERELVQYKAGSFIVGTVTTGTPNVIAAKLIDNKFYWIDPLLSSDGLPTGEIQLSDSPALGVGNAGTQDDPGTAITWSAVDDTAYTEVAGITQDTATFGDGAGSFGTDLVEKELGNGVGPETTLTGHVQMLPFYWYTPCEIVIDSMDCFAASSSGTPTVNFHLMEGVLTKDNTASSGDATLSELWDTSTTACATNQINYLAGSQASGASDSVVPAGSVLVCTIETDADVILTTKAIIKYHLR